MVTAILRAVGTGRSIRLRPRPRQVTRHVDGIERAIHMRRVTSDALALRQVFRREHYGYTLFSPDSGPSVIFDCGAHIGLSTLFFSDRYPDARIVAVEPHPRNFELLVENTKDCGNVECLNAAVWPRKERLKIKNRWAQPWGFRVSEARRGSVESITLEELVDRYGGGPSAVLKLDVEGTEAHLIEALGPELLAVAGLTFIEYHGVSGRRARKMLESMAGQAKDLVGDTYVYVCAEALG